MTRSEMEEVFPIVAELAQKYTGYESTSITYEKTQMLMGAVMYFIEECWNANQSTPVDKKISVREQYEIGTQLVREKAESVKDIFNETSVYFEDYNVECLGDTVQKGIPEFLKWYDVRYCPQDTILTLDYPLLTSPGALRGVDLVYQYMRGIQAEQQMLRSFDRAYVGAALKGYHADYKSMVENICEIVLTNTIGHIAIEKPLSDTGFGKEEYEKVAEVFRDKSVDSIEHMIKAMTEYMLEQLCQEEYQNIQEYVNGGARNIAARIHTAVQCKHLEKIFVF